MSVFIKVNNGNFEVKNKNITLPKVKGFNINANSFISHVILKNIENIKHIELILDNSDVYMCAELVNQLDIDKCIKYLIDKRNKNIEVCVDANTIMTKCTRFDIRYICNILGYYSVKNKED